MNPEFPFSKGQEGFPEGTEGRNLPERDPFSSSGAETGRPPKDLATPESAPLDEELLDRLVDGELSLAEQRKAIQQVQAHPEGWRRLALAFLEAQAWRKDFPLLVGSRSLDRAPSPAQPASVGRRTPASGIRKNLVGWQLLALAGGILLAFCGGYWTKDLLTPLLSRPHEGVVQQGESTKPEGRERFPEGKDVFAKLPKYPSFSQQPSRPEELVPREQVAVQEPSSRPGSSGWDYVTLTAGTGPDGIPEMVRIPIRPAGPDARLPVGPLPIPEELLEVLRQWGAGVSHSRQWVPLRMEDGRQVVVPVEQVELYYRPQTERYQ